MAGAGIIDCCSLINLHAGWGGLAELRALGSEWFVSDAVLSEAQYVGEFESDGSRILVEVDVRQHVQAQLVQVIRPETEEEFADYIAFAEELDDGEAQSLALAKRRGLIVLTDDQKARQVASRPEVGVLTLTTAEILRRWAELNPDNLARLSEVIRRVEVLARFRPRTTFPEYAWWLENCPISS